MSIEKVRNYFKTRGIDHRILEFDCSSATVALAAQALHCEENRIAKTLSFHVGERVILVVAAGDAKIDNAKYKAFFGAKAKMLSFDEAEQLIGHAVGGVCPFAVNEGVEVYLDVSLKRFKTVFPACGSSNSAIEMSLPELEHYSNFTEWIDVCKVPQEEEIKKKIFVIGCGRWGSFIAWYLNHIGHQVTLYGRTTSKNMQQFMSTRKNEYLTLPESISLTTSYDDCKDADVIVISVSSQTLYEVVDVLEENGIRNKIIVLCMKGIEIESGRRLSQIVTDTLDASNKVAVWLGPGHVQEFCRGVPNCMVIDSDDEKVKDELVRSFSSELIRFYYGTDLIGNEIGGAAKNVIGIAAGALDGLDMASLKGALMARGTREIARLIEAMGGDGNSAYGLCHLGDYEATLFSKHSQNRAFGESLVTKTNYTKLAEGYYTVKALRNLGKLHGVDLPICEAIYNVLYEGEDLEKAFEKLFKRSLKEEF